MDRIRRSLVALHTSWIILSAFVSALCVHAFIEQLQRVGIFTGNYARHAHGLVPAVILGAVCAAVAAAILYIISIVHAARPWLPSLAHTLRLTAGWQLLVAIVAAASFVLIGMELLEQAVANQHDGVMSAFGDQWSVGLLALVACAACMIGLGRALCAWLIKAHNQILRLALSLLNADPHTAVPPRWQATPAPRIRHHNPKPAVLGSRAPPLLLAR
jgi:hypothetical protein